MAAACLPAEVYLVMSNLEIGDLYCKIEISWGAEIAPSMLTVNSDSPYNRKTILKIATVSVNCNLAAFSFLKNWSFLRDNELKFVEGGIAR